uniref:Uncharacterized protein n=1 Tax=Octopus bimaculoides TaxID=37653 RepID=A0A0L8HU76_OCTBM
MGRGFMISNQSERSTCGQGAEGNGWDKELRNSNIHSRDINALQVEGPGRGSVVGCIL